MECAQVKYSYDNGLLFLIIISQCYSGIVTSLDSLFHSCCVDLLIHEATMELFLFHLYRRIKMCLSVNTASSVGPVEIRLYSISYKQKTEPSPDY